MVIAIKYFSEIINIYFLALVRRVINLNPDNFESIVNEYIQVSEINIDISDEEEENTSMFLRLEFSELFLTVEVCHSLRIILTGLINICTKIF